MNTDTETWDGIERGTCPACGSGRVRHSVAGMVLSDTVESAPDWVDFAGCLPLMDDRSCDACDHQWSSFTGRPSIDDAPDDVLRALGLR